MKKYLVPIFAVISVSFSGSCTTSPVCAVSSITLMQDKIITENLGDTTGEDSAVSVLGIWMIGHPDIGAAIDRAKNSKNADGLINVRCYESYSYFILFSVSTVRVEGEAVRFKPIQKGVNPDLKGKTR